MVLPSLDAFHPETLGQVDVKDNIVSMGGCKVEEYQQPQQQGCNL